MYSGQITLNTNDKCSNTSEGDTSKRTACLHGQSPELVDMFILKDYLDDTKFCNAVIDKFKSIAFHSRCVPSRDAVCRIWGRTSPNCQLRELCLQRWASALNNNLAGPWLKHEETTGEFLADFLLFLRRRHGVTLAKSIKRDHKLCAQKCSFHTHVDDSDKCS